MILFGSFLSSKKIIMLSLVHTPHQLKVPLIRVAYYGTPAKTLDQGDVIELLPRELRVSL